MMSVCRQLLDYLPARRSSLFYLCSLAMVASLVLGGGTRGGFLSDAILQLLTIPVLLAALWNIFEVPLSRQARWALLFCLAIVLLPILQLIPLPPALWTALPNRAPSAQAIALAGQELPWMPISVSPHATWLAVLSLIPIVAIFLCTVQLSYEDRRLLSLVVLAVGVVSVFVGLIQVGQGQSSPLRFFEFTNTTEAVGFFANRNHFAALLYALTLIAAGWAAYALMADGPTSARKIYEAAWILPVAAAFIVLVVLVAAQAMARSRAGLALTIVALFGAFALGISRRRMASSVFTTSRLLVSAVVVAGMFTVQFALYRILEKFAVDPMEDGRISFARNAIAAAKAYMPIGSGVGTFVPVYSMFEKPEHAMANTYVNRAHNDFLEVGLEGGILNLILIGFFAFWLTLRSIHVWRHAPPLGAREIDWFMARAATVIIVLILAHSFVDYPLRTGAIMAIMVFACGLLIRPQVAAKSGDRLELHDTLEPVKARRSARQTVPSTAITAGAALTVRCSADPQKAISRPRSDWAIPEMEWPEAWCSRKSNPRSTSGYPSSSTKAGGVTNQKVE